MIPDSTNNAGVNPAEIVRQYLRALNTDVKNLGPDSPLFYRGNPAKEGRPSQFVNAPIGKSKFLKFHH